MRITTHITVSMVTGEVLQHDWYDYRGPIAKLKGDSTAKAAEQAQLQNSQQQMQFSQQLMDLFKQQFAEQSPVLKFLQGKMQSQVENPTGYSDEAQAAMRANANDQLTTQYQNAQQALQAKEFAQGSRDIPSDVNGQLNGALLQAEASDKGASQNNITLANENLKQQNYWNAVQGLSGVAAAYNPLGYSSSAQGASGASSTAGNSTANLSQAVTASSGPTFGSILGGLAGGALGAAGNAGSFGKLFSCWVAARIYGGWYKPQTVLVRNWLNTEFTKHWYGRVLMHLYAKHGQRVAKNPVLVRSLTPFFNMALGRAA